jgi:hypothetical protein
MSETATQADAPAPTDIEVRARAMGWKPKEEYRGPDAGWRDADEFVRRGETELPVIRERYRATERKLAEVSGELKQATTVIADLTERFRTSDERAYKRAKADLVRERDAAIETGDKAAVHRVDAEIAEVERTAPKPVAPAPTAPPPQAPHPDAVEWAARNRWYQAGTDLANYAMGIHQGLLRTEPDLTVAENLERVTSAMRALYPDRIPAARAARQTPAEQEPPDDNPRRTEPAAVSGSSAPRGPARPNPRSFEAMPADSRAAFTKYAKAMEGKGKPLTKEEWAGTYWGQFQESA